MSTHNAGAFSGIWRKLVRSLVGEGHLLGQDDPRGRSWARRIGSFAELPAVYRPLYDDFQPSQREPFPYTVLTPTGAGGYGHKEQERLLAIADGVVRVSEIIGGNLHSTDFSPATISFIERGSILLHAWITIHAMIGTSVHTLKIRYNAVTDLVMAPFVEFLRPPAAAGPEVDPQSQRSRLDYLVPKHFKFMSYARSSIRPGARVSKTVFQPAIRRELFGLSRFSLSHLISPAHLSILTDNELILIRDDDSQHWSQGSPHGAIWTYIPRARILQLCLSPVDDGRVALSITLPGGTIPLLFDPAQRSDLVQLVNELQC